MSNGLTRGYAGLRRLTIKNLQVNFFFFLYYFGFSIFVFYARLYFFVFPSYLLHSQSSCRGVFSISQPYYYKLNFSGLIKMDKCAVCGVPAESKCSSCNTVFYCSREHQIADWKAKHKNDCKCYEVKKHHRTSQVKSFM